MSSTKPIDTFTSDHRSYDNRPHPQSRVEERDPFYVVSKMIATIMKYHSWSLLLNIKKLFFAILSL